MEPSRRKLLAATAAAITLAGCTGGDGGDGGGGDTTTTTSDGSDGGGGGYGGGGAATDTVTETSDSGSPAVGVRSHPDHGDVLVDSEGMTLYMFDADTRGAGESACTGGCADAWPPLTAGDDPVAGDGITATLSTFERGDGTTQVAANGWPLYTFASDEAPGDANGQGVNDVWWVLGPGGTPKKPGSTPTETGTGTAATVQVRSHPDHGDVLVDSEGMTLYMFDADTRGSGESACTGGCADAWPPLTVEGSPTAGDGVTATLSTFERSDGTTQVAANGWPLYTFASDEAPGDANGQGANDVWWVLGPGGTPKKPTPTATETETTTTAPDVGETVRLSGFSFRPIRASIAPGEAVEWVNEDGAGHDVTATAFHATAADWEFSASLPGGASTTYTFEETGVYEYYCTIHGQRSMCGVVLVGDASLDAELPCEGGN